MEESSGREKRNESEHGAKDEATSKETLKDVEDNQKVSSGSSTSEPGPSPDGALDESDENKDAGPM